MSRNVMMPAPMTTVRRASRTRDEMICTPLIMMNMAGNRRPAAMTGAGMIANMPANAGTTAAKTRIAAIG
jgi:hypothetical protein